MKCDVSCKYFHMCWNIGEGTCEIGEDCDQYKPEPPTVAFLCKDKGTEYCHHTKHIEQARNFEKVGPNKWMEKEPKHGECKTCKHFVKGGLDGKTYVCEQPDIALDDYFDYACIMMNENDFCSRYVPREGDDSDRA